MNNMNVIDLPGDHCNASASMASGEVPAVCALARGKGGGDREGVAGTVVDTPEACLDDSMLVAQGGGGETSGKKQEGPEPIPLVPSLMDYGGK